jgi:AcrR family transcriptional regulator
VADKPVDISREQLPSGRSRHGLSPDEVAATQRARLLDGLIEAVARKGYAALTVGDVAAAARVSRRTFYEHFRDKEDCFMAAIDDGTQEILGQMASAAASADDWLGAVRASVAAYMRAFVERPDFAKAFNLEILAAGPRALEFRAEVHRRFAEMYRDLYADARTHEPDLPELPEVTFRLATGGFDEFLVEWMRQGRVADLEELAPLAAFLAHMLLDGASAAASELVGRSATFTVTTTPG